MDSEENKDLEIVMGGNSNLEISEVGDIMNDLKPNTTKEKKSIIIPVSMNKSQNTTNAEETNDESQTENEEQHEEIEENNDENQNEDSAEKSDEE